MAVRTGGGRWWLVPVAVLAGCAEEGARPRQFPVSGRVEYRGQPAAGAFLVFHPLGTPREGAEPLTALAGPDGSFEVSSQGRGLEGKGAPAGTYAVTVEWRKLIIQGQEATPGPNIVPVRYANPRTTPLRVTVSAGPNSLPPFQLTR